jgi:hypothetical protein
MGHSAAGAADRMGCPLAGTHVERDDPARVSGKDDVDPLDRYNSRRLVIRLVRDKLDTWLRRAGAAVKMNNVLKEPLELRR